MGDNRGPEWILEGIERWVGFFFESIPCPLRFRLASAVPNGEFGEPLSRQRKVFRTRANPTAGKILRLNLASHPEAISFSPT